MNEINQICECGHDFGNHTAILGSCMLCECGSPRLPRPKPVSRRGFISMLGSALVVAAAPEIITMPFRTGMDGDFDVRNLRYTNFPMSAADFRAVYGAALNQVFDEMYAGYKISWVADDGLVVKPVHRDDIYLPASKGEDHGSSSET